MFPLDTFILILDAKNPFSPAKIELHQLATLTFAEAKARRLGTHHMIRKSANHPLHILVLVLPRTCCRLLRLQSPVVMGRTEQVIFWCLAVAFLPMRLESASRHSQRYVRLRHTVGNICIIGGKFCKIALSGHFGNLYPCHYAGCLGSGKPTDKSILFYFLLFFNIFLFRLFKNLVPVF